MRQQSAALKPEESEMGRNGRGDSKEDPGRTEVGAAVGKLAISTTVVLLTLSLPFFQRKILFSICVTMS